MTRAYLAWNGGFTFECVRRGAAHVLAFGPDDSDACGFNKIKKQLGIKNVEHLRGSIYDASALATYDIVLFFGVLYHLRYPSLALGLAGHSKSDKSPRVAGIQRGVVAASVRR